MNMGKQLAYFRPESLENALEFLSENLGDTVIIAGGTDVMVDVRSGEISPGYLLDVSRLEELHGIRMEDGELVVGAGVTISELGKSELIAEYAPTLGKCTENFAGTQIRNMATIGGNVAHCSPCGDTIPPLVIHEAEVLISSPSGQKRVPITDIATGPYRCMLPANEIITSFILKPKKADFAAFHKIGRRKDLAISRLSMALMLDKDEIGRISFMRLSLGACTPTPHRMVAVEQFMTGQILSKELLFEGGRLLAEKMIAITGRRSSIIYKEPAVQGLFVKMIYPVL